MNQIEFLKQFQEILDREEETDMQMQLADMEEWDSLAAMAFIGMAARIYGKTIRMTDFENTKTVQNLYDLLF